MDWVGSQLIHEPDQPLGNTYVNWLKLLPKLVEPYFHYEGRTVGKESPSQDLLDWNAAVNCRSGICPVHTSTVVLFSWSRM
jgi:hypothetical protein